MPEQRKIILMMETSRAYGRSILRGIARYVRTHGSWVFHRSAPFYWGASEARNTLESLFKLEADGIILREQHNRDQMERVLSWWNGRPAVVSPYTEPFPGVPNILTDDQAIGRMAAEYLLHRGFRQYAYCGFGDAYYWSRERGRSFCNRVREAGFEVHGYDQERPRSRARPSWEAEQAVLVDWLKSLPQPVGIMACNDDRSQYLLEACKLADLRVPEQIAIVGVGNDDLICDLAAPPLSSVRQVRPQSSERNRPPLATATTRSGRMGWGYTRRTSRPVTAVSHRTENGAKRPPCIIRWSPNL